MARVSARSAKFDFLLTGLFVAVIALDQHEMRGLAAGLGAPHVIHMTTVAQIWARHFAR